VFPTFLVIGAKKAGTTSLHNYLGEHPEIFMSALKEPTYFTLTDPRPPGMRALDRQMVSTREEYELLFEGVDGERAVGESSTAYLPCPDAAGRIHDEIPDAKLIVVLRNPSDRTDSAHRFYVFKGYETLSLDDAIDEELAGGSWRTYVGWSMYADAICRYRELFGANQVKVILSNDLDTQPREVLGDVFEWLGVNSSFTPDVSRRHNVTPTRPQSSPAGARSLLHAAMPKRARERIRHRQRDEKPTRSTPLSEETRQRLVGLFADDIRRVERLIDRDLSTWLTVHSER